MSEWISVDDRLPENVSFVWVVSSGDVGIAQFIAVFGNIWRDICGGNIDFVTHWQPLDYPPPPDA